MFVPFRRGVFMDRSYQYVRCSMITHSNELISRLTIARIFRASVLARIYLCPYKYIVIKRLEERFTAQNDATTFIINIYIFFQDKNPFA